MPQEEQFDDVQEEHPEELADSVLLELVEPPFKRLKYFP
jgi:hypothetical protein